MPHLTIRQTSAHLAARHSVAGWFSSLSITVLVLGFALAAVPRLLADSQVRAVRLSSVDGSVQLLTGSETAFTQAYPNMPLTEGMRIQTGGDGRAEIQFEDGSTTRLTPNSSLVFSKLSRAPNGATRTEMQMLSGLGYFELDSAHGIYKLAVGGDQITSEKGASFRVSMDASPAQIAVLHGTLNVESASATPVELQQNSTLRVDLNNPSQIEVAQGITADSWDQWNRDRDKSMQQMATLQNSARQGYGNSADPAWSQLDFYGNWYNLPGYGPVWTPAGMGAGFDPFGNGMWGNYPGYGPTWISGYSWGWWPYHCGAWNYFNSMGWGWMPGDCGFGYGYGGWSPTVSVWNVPRGYVPPSRPKNFDPRGNLPGHGGGGNLIAVNRGDKATEIWKGEGSKPEGKTIRFSGAKVAPVMATIRTEPIARPGQVTRGVTSTTPGVVARSGAVTPTSPRSGGAQRTISSGFRNGPAVAPRSVNMPAMHSSRGIGGGNAPSFHPPSISTGGGARMSGGSNIGSASHASSGAMGGGGARSSAPAPSAPSAPSGGGRPH